MITKRISDVFISDKIGIYQRDVSFVAQYMRSLFVHATKSSIFQEQCCMKTGESNYPRAPGFT